MGKFCIYCGKQLAEGAECTCEQAQAARQAQGQQTSQSQQSAQDQQASQSQQSAQGQQASQPQQSVQGQQSVPQPQQSAQSQQASQPQQSVPNQQNYTAPAPNPAVTAMGNAFKSLLTIINKPMESLKGFVKAENFLAALILIGAQALIAAFFSLALAGSMQLGEITNLAAIFFETFAFSLVLSAVLFGVMFLMIIIFKGKTDAKSLLCVVAVRSVVTIPFMVLGLLVGLANPALGLGLFIICEFFAMFYMYMGMRFACSLEESRMMFVVPIAMTVVVVVLALIMQGLAKAMISDILGNALGGMSGLFNGLY